MREKSSITTLAVCLLIIMVCAWMFSFVYDDRSQRKFMKKLETEGVRRVAYISEMIRYFPSQGKGGYGQLVYEYQNIKGEIFKKKLFVSKETFDKYEPGEPINILYDPDDTKQSLPVELIKI